ncbi:MAG TPA: outer membrane beta-barrel protein [Povalibacter sp.]
MNSRSLLRAAALLASTLCCAGALAQSRAVEKTHVELGLTSIDSDTEDSTSSGTLGLNLAATFPIGSYLGASLSGDFSKTSTRNRDVLGDNPDAEAGSRPSCNFENSGGNASLFFRRPNLGRVGVSYGVGNIKSDCDGESVFPLSGADKLKTDNYRAFAEYYISDFTFGASYTTTKLEDSDDDLKTTALSASWYPFDSLKVSLAGSDLYEENTYGITVEHQPEMLGDGLSVWLGFSSTDAEPKTQTINIGIAYFFGRTATLKDRDRQYR